MDTYLSTYLLTLYLYYIPYIHYPTISINPGKANKQIWLRSNSSTSSNPTTQLRVAHGERKGIQGFGAVVHGGGEGEEEEDEGEGEVPLQGEQAEVVMHMLQAGCNRGNRHSSCYH